MVVLVVVQEFMKYVRPDATDKDLQKLFDHMNKSTETDEVNEDGEDGEGSLGKSGWKNVEEVGLYLQASVVLIKPHLYWGTSHI